MHDRESALTTALERQPGSREEGIRVFGGKAGLAATWRIRSVFIKFDRVDYLMRRVALPLGAYNGNLVAGQDKRLAFKPYPPVEGNGEILDDDQNPGPHDYKNPVRNAVIRQAFI